jgi:hypothetical protein
MPTELAKVVIIGQENPDKTIIITIIIKRRLKVLEHRLAPPVRRDRVVLVVRVKVGAVERALDGRQPGRLDALREQALPVDAGEPLVVAHVAEAALEVSEALWHVPGRGGGREVGARGGGVRGGA